MVKAYIMTCMDPGPFTTTLDEIKKISNVEKISVVTGDYDFVVKVNVKNLGALHRLTNRLQGIRGIQKTTTQVIEKEIDLSKSL